MNRTMLARLIGAIFMAPDPGTGGGGGGGGGGGDVAAVATEARTFLTDLGHSADSLKGMKDEDVVKLHGTVKTNLDKHGQTAAEKARAAKLEAAKGLKLELPKETMLTADDVAEVTALAQKEGLSDAEAKAILQQRDTALKAHVTRQIKAAETRSAAWAESIKKDPEVGGEKLVESQRVAQLVIDKAMPQALRTYLRETKLGDHPDVFKFLVKVGGMMKEDTPPKDGGGQGGKKDAADILYGSSQ